MNPEPTFPVAIDVSAVHPASGGVRTYVHALVAHLPAVGVAPVLLARRGDDQPWPGAAAVHRVAPAPRPVRLVWEQAGLVRALRRLPEPVPEVLHSPHYTMPERVGRSKGPARVVTIHDLTFFTRPEAHDRVKRLLFRRAITVAARRADALVCVSNATAQLLGELVRPRVPVHVVPHGVDHERFRPYGAPTGAPSPGDDLALLADLGVRTPYVVHVGAIEPRKNLEALVAAYGRVVGDGAAPDGLTLVLAGGAWRGADDRLAPPAAGSLVRLGFVEDRAVPALYRQAAAVAYPSLEEGFGLPVLEALACGAPVVTSRSGATGEVAGDAAVLVDPSSPDDLALGLERALRGDAPPLAARFSRASAYTWDASARAHASVYRSARDARPAR